MIYTQIQ